MRARALQSQDCADGRVCPAVWRDGTRGKTEKLVSRPYRDYALPPSSDLRLQK